MLSYLSERMWYVLNAFGIKKSEIPVGPPRVQVIDLDMDQMQDVWENYDILELSKKSTYDKNHIRKIEDLLGRK